MTLVTETTIEDLFEELVSKAVKERRVELSEFTSQHLTKTLVQYAQIPEHNVDVSPSILTQETDEQRLMSIGEHCLISLGWYRDSFFLRERIFSTEYYEQIGRRAYLALGTRKEGLSPFKEIAKRFRDLTIILGVVRAYTLPKEKIMDVIGLYIKTRDPYYAAMLHTRNIDLHFTCGES